MSYERVCLSVCLCYVRTNISRCPNFTKSSVHVACGRSSVLLWRRCSVLLVLWMTSCFPMAACFTGLCQRPATRNAGRRMRGNRSRRQPPLRTLLGHVLEKFPTSSPPNSPEILWEIWTPSNSWFLPWTHTRAHSLRTASRSVQPFYGTVHCCAQHTDTQTVHATWRVLSLNGRCRFHE